MRRLLAVLVLLCSGNVLADEVIDFVNNPKKLYFRKQEDALALDGKTIRIKAKFVRKFNYKKEESKTYYVFSYSPLPGRSLESEFCVFLKNISDDKELKTGPRRKFTDPKLEARQKRMAYTILPATQPPQVFILEGKYDIKGWAKMMCLRDVIIAR